METIRTPPPLLRHNGSSPGLHLVWTIHDVGTSRVSEKKKESGEEKGESYFLF
jgi:hypothetical protein